MRPSFNRDEMVSCLDRLIAACRDTENAFRAAASGVRNPRFASLFGTYARQREQFAQELQEEIRRRGSDPEQAGNARGSLRRGWVRIKAALARGHDAEIIDELERSEEAAVQAYLQATPERLPEDLAVIVERQSRQIQEARSRLGALKQPRAA